MKTKPYKVPYHDRLVQEYALIECQPYSITSLSAEAREKRSVIAQKIRLWDAIHDIDWWDEHG